MSCGSMILAVELRAGAKLFRYPQQAGGYRWALTGARCVPASLDKICDEMLRDGLIDESDCRGEYVLWEKVKASK